MEYASPALLNFLQLPSFTQQQILEQKKILSGHNNDLSKSDLRDHANTLNQFEVKRSQTIQLRNAHTHGASFIKSTYLQYFDVQFLNYTKDKFVSYNIQISLMIPNSQEVWTIEKRYTDFYELNETLKVFLGLKHLPYLPKKKIGTLDDKDIQERIEGLEDYLKNLLNDKLYHHYSLFKFIQLKPNLEK